MLISPPFLQKGDTVAITAPASKVNPESLSIGLAILRDEWGLEVIVGESVGAVENNYSGSEILRQSEFQAFLDNPKIKLILAARGGYGCSKFIDKLNLRKFKKNPKWICGFSDLTAMLLELNNAGFEALHGPMAKTMSFDKESNQYLKQILFGSKTNYDLIGNKFNKKGRATGQALGGNLVLLTHSIGSKSDINYQNKILFLEDIGEYYYNIDRMLVQLKRAGKLKKLAGLVIGDFSDCKENIEPFGKNIEEIILDVCQEYSFPIAFGLPFGHEKLNFPIVMGADYELTVNAENFNLRLV